MEITIDGGEIGVIRWELPEAIAKKLLSSPLSEEAAKTVTKIIIASQVKAFFSVLSSVLLTPSHTVSQQTIKDLTTNLLRVAEEHLSRLQKFSNKS